MSGVNVITTTFLMRAPGMTMWRLPVFTWNVVVTAILGLVAFLRRSPPSCCCCSIAGSAAKPSIRSGAGIDRVQHLFWFSVTRVYIPILPVLRGDHDTIPVFSRKPLFGYTGFILATSRSGRCRPGSGPPHVHDRGGRQPVLLGDDIHDRGSDGREFFNWIGTMWGGKLSFRADAVPRSAFANFLIGGITGVMLASAPLDFQLADRTSSSPTSTTMMGGSVFGIFAAIYLRWKAFGTMLSGGSVARSSP